MAWFSQSKGGGGTTDTTARAQASAASSKIDAVLKSPGDKVKAKSTTFIVMSDGSIGQYSNPTAADITVPASATEANILAAGLTKPTTSGTDSRLNNIYKVSGDKVPAGAEVFIVNGTGAPINYRNPTAGDLTVPASTTNADILAAGFAPIAAKEQHLHSILANSSTLAGSDTIFKVASSKLWRNIVANPDITKTPADAIWKDEWVEAIPAAATGLTYASVKDNDTLTAKQFSVAEPLKDVVVHLTAPAATKNSFYTVINTGAGIVDVGGVQVIGNGALEFTSNEAGTAWVLTAKEGVVQASADKTCKTFTQTAHGFVIGNAVYFNGTSDKFELASSVSDITSDSIGLVTRVPDANTFEIGNIGWIENIAQTGLTPGAIYLSATAGVLTETPPTTGFIKAVLLLKTANSGWILHNQAMSADLASSNIKEIGNGSTLPVDNSVNPIFVLKGHSILPDSVYWFDAVSTQWVQI